MREFTKSELPANTRELMEAGKVTYRGCGLGKNAHLTRVRIEGKEYAISWDLFHEISEGVHVRFSGPARKG
jgi:hypothetical protein